MTLRLCRRRPEAQIDGARVKLTWQTWQLLGFLLDEGGGPLSNAVLCDRFHFDGENDACNSSVLQVVHRSRAVLARAGHGDLIESVPGQGYRLRGIA